MPLTYTCDIAFNFGSTIITNSSGPGIADGSVIVDADGTGTIRYSISSAHSPTDPPYASRTNVTGVFTGLLPGTYIVNARTNDSCKQEITIVIDYVSTWVPRYRMQYGTSNLDSGLLFRIDIEDNQYVGSVEYVYGSADPTTLTWTNNKADNVFEPVIGSELTINLISPTDGYFDILNGFDEKRFRATYYVDSGSGYEQKWQGFIVPQNSDEEYCRDVNYGVTFTFSDGLADLSNKDYSDDSGNVLKGRISVLQGIIFCLNKTSLQLDIWETVNFTESGMLSGINDSTLEQAYFDPEVYLTEDGTMEDCLTVLSSLVLNFAARITQSNGVWCIDCPTLKTGSTTATRKFDHTGTFLSGANESYRILLRRGNAVSPKISFKDFGAVKSHQTMYGLINFTFDYSLRPNPSVIVGGDFENEDLINGQLTDWQINQEVPVAVNPTLETVSRDKETVSQVLQINFDNFFSVASYSGAEPRAIVSSKPVHFDFTAAPTGSKMSLSFDVFVNAYSQQPYIFFDFQVYFDSVINGDCYLAYDASVSTNNYGMVVGGLAIENVEGKYIRIYLEPGKWNTITADFIVSVLDEGDLQMIFRANGNLQYDVASIAALQGISTNGFSDEEVNMRAGRDNRRRAFDNIYSSGINTVRQYVLTAGTGTADGYNIVIPNDQLGPLEYYWKLDKVLTPDANLWAKNIQLDNVVLKYLPEAEAPVSKEETSVSLNVKIKNPLDVTFRHGDLPEDVNYKNIMRGWLSLSDGSPTSEWLYKSPTPPHSLPVSIIDMLKKLYSGQYGRDRWKLSGPAICMGVIPFIDRPIYEVKTGRIYAMVYPSFMGRLPAAQIQMIEALNGAAVIDEGVAPDPDIEPPVVEADFLLADFSPTDFVTA